MVRPTPRFSGSWGGARGGLRRQGCAKAVLGCLGCLLGVNTSRIRAPEQCSVTKATNGDNDEGTIMWRALMAVWGCLACPVTFVWN